MLKKYFVILLIASPLLSIAQLGKFANKVKDKMNQKVNTRIDNKVDKTLDKTLDGIEGKNTTPIPVEKNEPGSKTSTETGKKGLKSYSKYDFVPGEKILYAEDLSQESVAELPTGWNTNGSGEVVRLENLPGNWLRMHKSFIYLTGNTNEFSENYTVEFDLILQLKNNGWMYPTFSIGLFATNGEPNTDNAFLKDYHKYNSVVTTIIPEENSNSKVRIESFSDLKKHFTSEPKNYDDLDKYYGTPVHVSMQVQKQRFRMWINETKLFDVPKAVDTSYKMNQLFFAVSQTNYNEEQYGVYVSNIKIATGLPDTRHKLMEEGKFSTTGILFDINSAVIKPESFGVIKEIAKTLQENPTVKIKIIGHTSSDGDDKANLELSAKRAAAVKDLLVAEYAIDPKVIETEGKGETQPVADNNSKEGKSQNRRVEFIKL